MVFLSFRDSESVAMYVNHMVQGCFWDGKVRVRLGGEITKALKAVKRGLNGLYPTA